MTDKKYIVTVILLSDNSELYADVYDNKAEATRRVWELADSLDFKLYTYQTNF